jgi:hypothetical protein
MLWVRQRLFVKSTAPTTPKFEGEFDCSLQTLGCHAENVTSKTSTVPADKLLGPALRDKFDIIVALIHIIATVVQRPLIQTGKGHMLKRHLAIDTHLFHRNAIPPLVGGIRHMLTFTCLHFSMMRLMAAATACC